MDGVWVRWKKKNGKGIDIECREGGGGMLRNDWLWVRRIQVAKTGRDAGLTKEMEVCWHLGFGEGVSLFIRRAPHIRYQ